MSSFMYGLRVTPNEEIILNKILTETDKIAKVRHLRAVHSIARRNNIDMEKAENIYTNNQNIVREMNKNSVTRKFFIGKNGAVCEILSGGACPKFKEFPDKDAFTNTKIPKKGIEKIADKIRAFVKFFKELFA